MKKSIYHLLFPVGGILLIIIMPFIAIGVFFMACGELLLGKEHK